MNCDLCRQEIDSGFDPTSLLRQAGICYECYCGLGESYAERSDARRYLAYVRGLVDFAEYRDSLIR